MDYQQMIIPKIVLLCPAKLELPSPVCKVASPVSPTWTNKTSAGTLCWGGVHVKSMVSAFDLHPSEAWDLLDRTIGPSSGGSRHDGHALCRPGGGCRDPTTAGGAACGGSDSWAVNPEVFSSSKFHSMPCLSFTRGTCQYRFNENPAFICIT